MERLFQISAVILAGVAAYFLWAGNGDGAFVSAVLGAVSFFLSVRFQVKERNRIRESERAESEIRALDEGYEEGGATAVEDFGGRNEVPEPVDRER